MRQMDMVVLSFGKGLERGEAATLSHALLACNGVVEIEVEPRQPTMRISFDGNKIGVADLCRIAESHGLPVGSLIQSPSYLGSDMLDEILNTPVPYASAAGGSLD